MKLTTISISLALALSGCGKKDEAGGGAASKTAETGDKAAAGADKAAAGPKTMAAPELFADYNKPGQDGMALMEKWRDGVIVTGEVTNVITEEAGNSSLFVKAGDTGKMSLGFADDGKAVKEKALKAGDSVTAKCQIGGSDGTLMMLTDCELK